MKRIGIAASKIAKGNLLLYNSYVILIAFLFSLFVFVIAGSTLLIALIVFANLGSKLLAFDVEMNWPSILLVCMGTLTIVIAIINLFAILTNFKFVKGKE